MGKLVLETSKNKRVDYEYNELNQLDVITSVGLVAIEHIKPGDMVLAENEETSETAYKEVVRTFTSMVVR